MQLFHFVRIKGTDGTKFLWFVWAIIVGMWYIFFFFLSILSMGKKSKTNRCDFVRFRKSSTEPNFFTLLFRSRGRAGVADFTTDGRVIIFRALVPKFPCSIFADWGEVSVKSSCSVRSALGKGSFQNRFCEDVYNCFIVHDFSGLVAVRHLTSAYSAKGYWPVGSRHF